MIRRTAALIFKGGTRKLLVADDHVRHRPFLCFSD
jgi:hypothetical protein